MQTPLALDMLFKWEKETPDHVYLRQPIDGQWHTWTWKEAASEVRRMAAYLKAQKFPAGSRIALFSKNCAHWNLADFSIMLAGHVSVPLYFSSGASTVKLVLEHSEAVFLFAGKLDHWVDVKSSVPKGIKGISFPYGSPKDFPNWNDIIKDQKPLEGGNPRKADELASIIYTSGTTGVPKGTMHGFGPLARSTALMVKTLKLKPQETFFSFMPLAHVAERMVTQGFTLYVGGTVSFVENPNTFTPNLVDASPTVFLAVPRIWVKFQEGVLARVPQRKLDKLLKIPILSTLVKRKIRKALGFKNLKLAITGAAPVAPALLEWWDKLGVVIREAYGMSENFCYSHYTPADDIRWGTSGIPWPEVKHRIGEGGELQVNSPGNFLGYYKNPELTKEVLGADGYIHTGDVGTIDKDQFLTITGRHKDVFKTEKAIYVAPGPIEMLLSDTPLIDSCCVVGSGLPQPLGLLVLSDSAKKLNLGAQKTAFTKLMKKVNAGLGPAEKLDKLILLTEPWTVENGLVTPTLKVKRNEIEKRFAAKFKDWAARSEELIFVD